METLTNFLTPDMILTISSFVGLLLLTGFFYLLKYLASKTTNEIDDKSVDILIKNLEEAKKKVKNKK